jgi:hypothetical protein
LSRPGGPTITGDWQRLAADFARAHPPEKLKRMDKAQRIYERLTPRDQERFKHWPCDVLLDHFAQKTPRKTPPAARPRTSRRRTTSGSSRDGPPREDSDDDLVPLPKRVSAERLAALLRERLPQGWTVDAVADEAQIPARQLRRILDGEQAQVNFATADKIVTRVIGVDAWEVELADLYAGVAA